MRRKEFTVFIFIVMIITLSSCSISNHSMKSPNYHIEFYKGDFEYSQQVTTEATSIRVLGIDWQRLFKWELGEISSDRFEDQVNKVAIHGQLIVDPIIAGLSTLIPVLGDYKKGKVSSYALYKLMRENPGYDIVIYPQYETKRFIIPIFIRKEL